MSEIKIENIDCLQGFLTLKDESVDCVVTDPPYRITSCGNSKNCSMSGYWVLKKARSGRIFDYNDIDIEDYLAELYRVLKDRTHCYIMCNNLNLPHFFDVISKSKFNFVKLLAWDKCSPICGRYYMSRIEHVFFLRKGGERPINHCGSQDLIIVKNDKPKDKHGNNIHDSAKPVPLFQHFIVNSTNENDLVLDPFVGSGTTAIACINTNRNFVGFEIDQKYYDACMTRIKSAARQNSLF